MFCAKGKQAQADILVVAGCILICICVTGTRASKKSLLNSDTEQEEDIISEYLSSHASKRHHSHRHVRDCQPIKFGNVTYEEKQTKKKAGKPYVDVKYFAKKMPNFSNRTVYGHVAYINDARETVSVLEPGVSGSCSLQKGTFETVAKTAEQKKCLYAVNAGFFNTKTGGCYGNVISDGKLAVNTKGIQNPHFGITKDGKIYTGFVTEEEVTSGKFLELVGGVVWLIRDGHIYINQSKEAECADIQETGTLEKFINVLSGRTAIGHDAEGTVMIVQVDGRTLHRGATLWEFASFLLDLGMVNAVNLDGGGSTTTVINGTVVNYPSDKCGNFNCARKVSTIVCAHVPDSIRVTAGVASLQKWDRCAISLWVTILTVLVFQI